jgi:hypothetical protein
MSDGHRQLGGFFDALNSAFSRWGREAALALYRLFFI